MRLIGAGKATSVQEAREIIATEEQRLEDSVNKFVGTARKIVRVRHEKLTKSEKKFKRRNWPGKKPKSSKGWRERLAGLFHFYYQPMSDEEKATFEAEKDMPPGMFDDIYDGE